MGGFQINYTATFEFFHNSGIAGRILLAIYPAKDFAQFLGRIALNIGSIILWGGHWHLLFSFLTV
jgi:hypothetical protein